MGKICYAGEIYCDCGSGGGGGPVTCTALSAPVIANQTLVESTNLNIDASVTSGEAPLSYSAAGLPAWASIDGSTGLITGTAPAVTADTDFAGITVTVTDSCINGAQSEISGAFTITVQDAATLAAPNISCPADILIDVGDGPTTGQVTNSGGAVSSWSIAPTNAGISIDASGLIAVDDSVPIAQAAYTVTASNAAGSHTCQLDIGVSAVATAITAEAVYAPSVDFPDGTFTELLDVASTDVASGGANKGLALIIRNISGGDGGPYTVDFSQVDWIVQEDGTSMDRVEVNWGKNTLPILLNPVAAQQATVNGPSSPPGAGLSGGNHAGAIVANVTASDWAGIRPTAVLTTAPPNGLLPYFIGCGYPNNVVVVSDGSGNSMNINVSAHSDLYSITGTGPIV